MADSSGEKTEQPTQKRLRDARKKGQVAKSQDLSSAIMLISSVCIIWLLSGALGGMFLTGVREQFTYAASFKGDFNEEVALSALFGGVKLMAIALVPLLGAMFIIAFAVNFLQVGSLFSFEAISPNFSKLNPVEAFKQKFFKMKSYIELGKTILKIIITATVVYYVLSASVSDLVKLTYQPLPVALAFVFGLTMQIFLTVGIAFLIIGAGDFFLQHFLHKKELMMTKQEVKEEWKEMEGDPYIKSKRKQLHREIISQAVAAKVKTASVVVANPTHLAIALSYEQGSAGAPVIVAKGADYMALQIRSIAEEAGVPITRDVPLARSLYKLEVDDEIPEELYEAVAIVLRWVYDMAEEKA
jgi:type III secretion YscU/HrpY family protein